MRREKVLVTIEGETRKGHTVFQNKIITLTKAMAINNFIDQINPEEHLYVYEFDDRLQYGQIEMNIIDDPNIINAFKLLAKHIPTSMIDLIAEIEQAKKDFDNEDNTKN